MTKITQSKELTAFYNAYHNWLEAGAPVINKYDFRRYDGLCVGLFNYYFEEIKNPNEEFDYLKAKIQLKDQFNLAGLAVGYPFGVENYSNRSKNNTQHLDPNRIAWVKAHLTEEVEKEFILQ